MNFRKECKQLSTAEISVGIWKVSGVSWVQFCRCSQCKEMPGTEHKLLIKTKKSIRKPDAVGRGDVDTNVTSASEESVLSRNRLQTMSQLGIPSLIWCKGEVGGRGVWCSSQQPGKRALWVDASKAEQHLLRLKKKWALCAAYQELRLVLGLQWGWSPGWWALLEAGQEAELQTREMGSEVAGSGKDQEKRWGWKGGLRFLL